MSLKADLLRVRKVAGLAVLEGETGRTRAAADWDEFNWILEELGERMVGDVTPEESPRLFNESPLWGGCS